MNKVKKLKDSVAKKIAAGEVIDRPYSVVRELLDNSIDSGATEISLYLEDGGISNIRIVDNGQGMSKEDLSLCYLPHATSKIESEDDLLTLNSLGFRGEALSSISTCTKMSIVSKQKDGESHRLMVHGGEFLSLDEYSSGDGTIINASDLFYSIPARRKFLKKPSAENTLCRNTFLEKALPFPNINFKYYKDEKLDLFLPKSSLKDRVMNAYKGKFNSSLLGEVSCQENGYSITAVLGRPELHRKDRKYMHIYTNKRRITEFAFIQALQYGYNEVLPGGNFPIAFIFIDVDPSLIDFNIHPAKKEAKFRNLQTIHHRLVEMVKSFLTEYKFNLKTSHRSSMPAIRELMDFRTGISEPARQTTSTFKPTPKVAAKENFNNTIKREVYSHQHPKQDITEFMERAPELQTQKSNDFEEPSIQEKPVGAYRYMGQIMDVFLLVEKDNTLYVIDQHATHENILYDKLSASKAECQELLLPIEFDVSQEEGELIEKNIPTYLELGFNVEKIDIENWKIKTLPGYCKLMDSEIIDFIKTKKGGKGDIQRQLFSTLACRSAIKEGDPIDDLAAKELIEAAFKMDQARCPHGRPIWFELSKKELYELVGRI